MPDSFAALIEGIERRHAHLAQQLHDHASLVRYAPPELVLHPERPIDGNIAKALNDVFAIGWKVSIADGPGEPTLRRQELAVIEDARRAVVESPVVAAALAAFPGAELLENQG